jgi:pimeloyl-ACP methyl ester carboxylesterase
MTLRRALLFLCVLCVSAVNSSAQLPPAGKEIPAEDRQELEQGAGQLATVIGVLRKELDAKPDLLALLPDVQIYHKAVDWPLRYKEPLDVAKARAALAEGVKRARSLREGKPYWLTTGGARAYVSKIDNSIQPYLVAMPANYNAKNKGPYRLDFFFHGRDPNLTELAFISGKGQDAPTAPTDDKRFLIYTYGRYCVANKFAGEIDTLEVLDHVKHQYPIDDNRVLITGFSMGGAAAWHHAVHYPDLWAAASPGAGFCETRVYQKMDNKGEWDALPSWRRSLFRLYDCPDYALNLSMLPTIAYSGDQDPQQQSGDLMQKAVESRGYKLERIYGPNTGHKYEKKAKAELAARLDEIAAAGRNTAPKDLRFETWTLRYNRMHWLTVGALDRHWQRARVDGHLTEGTITLKTTNVAGLTIRFAPGQSPAAAGVSPVVLIDGTKVSAAPVGPDKSFTANYFRANGKWTATLPKPTGLRKLHGLQGPIDDAFLDAFLIVKPTGQPLHPATGKWADREFAHATTEWRKIFRGDAPTKSDTDITGADIAHHNLILFGDPSSNAILKRIAPQLPIKWSADAITLGDRTFPADRHALIAIYPNPLNPTKYVVLNSGFTFRQADHKTNSRQVAKLPDYAVIDLTTPPDDKTPGAIPAAGFFDEQWKLQNNDGQFE